MLPPGLVLAGGFLSFVSTGYAKQLACDNKIPIPEHFGTQVTDFQVKEVKGYDGSPPLGGPSSGPIDFCNVTITYTHPGQGDSVNVYVWLPLDGWNGRLLSQGGGGWAAGTEGALAPGIADGYAGANTDAGHTFQGDLMKAAADARGWAMSSPGNVNWKLLQNLASDSLDDMTHFAKAVINSFYGNGPKYSYWNGCSQGGRQGLMLAQRYPKNYDGILAVAPAINWVSFVVAELWGQVQMRKEKYWPPTCEWEAIRKAAIEACDELDGVKDGIIAAPGLCTFDALSVVGTKFDCDGETRKISKSAAKIANTVWEGPKRNGKLEWFGLTHETPLAVPNDILGGLLQTECDGKNTNCKGLPFPISKDWIQLFLAKDGEYDVEGMSEDEFFKFLRMSRQRYSCVVATDDPDLSEFRAAGGKMITWHGLADQLIFPNGTLNYYERVLEMDPKAHDFYRYFEAPGVMHCDGGIGAFPGRAFDSLVQWVEKKKAPDFLTATTPPAQTAKSRILCPYPKVAAYKGGNPDEASSFACANEFGSKKAVKPEHSEL